MNKTFLILLSSSTLLGAALSLMTAVGSVKASEVPSTQDSALCSPSPRTQQYTCRRLTPTTSQSIQIQVPLPDRADEEPEMLEFTEEESNAAVALFGCDCPACLNVLRQMRGLAPLSS
jgi:hypothetical protein